MPQVTVLMPVYNGSPYLEASIRSILEQTFTDFEFLILDDASTDGSPEVVRNFDDPRIRLVLNETNLGQTPTLNRGLALARGKYIARQDQDDLSAPTRLAQQVALLEQDPEIVLVSAQTVAIDGNGQTVFAFDYPSDHARLHWLLLTECPIFHSSVMFRRDFVLQRYGGYDPTFRYSQDYALWSRIVWDGRIANLPEVLNYWRVHTKAASSTLPGSIMEQEGLRTSYSNILRLGFDIGQDSWRRVYDLYYWAVTPATSAELLEAIDILHRLADRFLLRSDAQAESRRALERWIRDDITKRFLIRLDRLRQEGKRGLVLRAIARLIRYNPRTFRLGRRLIGQTILGADNYSRLRDLVIEQRHIFNKNHSSTTRRTG